MPRLTVVGPAFVAALALTALVAAPASASYNSEAASTTLSGTQRTLNEPHTVSGTWKCEVAKFSGSQTGAELASGVFGAPTITVHPTYEKCKAFGLVVTVTTTGCNYEFNEPEAGMEGSARARMSIECEAGKEIVVNAGFGSCVTRFPAQEVGGSVGFTNEGVGTARYWLLTFEINGMKYSQKGSTCTGGSQTREDGTYSGIDSTTGSSGGSQVGIWVTAS